MDDVERRRVEDEIRAEAERVALALADHPEFAIDVRDLVGDATGEIATRADLEDMYPIGGAEDMQDDPDARTYRRTRRLGELKLALDQVRGARWPR